MINIARSCCLGRLVCNSMLRACDRWKALWNAASARDVEMGPCHVFAKYALESCRLTEAYIEAIQSGDLNSPFMRIMAVDTTNNVNEFIQRISRRESQKN